MRGTLISQIIVRKLYSILFRGLIVLFSIYVLCSSDNFFSWEFYFSLGIIYFFVFLILIVGDGYFAQFRLIWDYTWIFIILFGKDVSNIENFIFFATPLINASNHSGKEINWRFLVITSILFFLLLSLIYTPACSKLDLAISLFIVYLLSVITASRKKNENKPIRQFSDVYDRINKLMDFPRSYKIYKPLLDQLNSLSYLSYDFKGFDNIICYMLREDNSWYLVNSSNFVYNYELPAFDKLDNLNFDSSDTEYINDIEVTLNGVKYRKTILIKVKSKQVFVYVLTNSNSDYLSGVGNIYLFDMISPIFERFSRVIEFEQIYKSQNKEYLEDIRDKFTFMRNSEKAMHFVKNKLSPLENLIEVLKDAMGDDELIIKDIDLRSYVKREIDRSETSINGVIQRAKHILDKSNTPFNVTSLENHKAYNVFAIFSELKDDFFSDDIPLEFQWDIESISNYHIKINKAGLYIVFTDWFSNMIKYGFEYKFLFVEDESNYIVEFINSYSKSMNGKVNKLVVDFNRDDRIEILRRQSHGLYEIKTSLEEMDLSGNMKNENNKLYFRINFKKYVIEEN